MENAMENTMENPMESIIIPQLEKTRYGKSNIIPQGFPQFSIGFSIAKIVYNIDYQHIINKVWKNTVKKQ